MQASPDLIAGLLTCEADSVPAENVALRDIEGWDSLKHVMLVVGLERHLKSKLSAEDIQGIVTVGDVVRVLRDRGVDG